MLRLSPRITSLVGLRRTLLAVLACASVTLLAGCAYWPKALTFGANSEPVQEAPIRPVEPVSVPVVDAPAPKPVVVQPLPAAPATPPPVAPVATIVLAPQATPMTASAPSPATNLVAGYYINVGLFSVPSNGTRAYKKLEGAGLPVFSDTVSSKKGLLTRLRVGPYPTQAKANAAAKQIHTLQLDARVFRHG